MFVLFVLLSLLVFGFGIDVGELVSVLCSVCWFFCFGVGCVGGFVCDLL